MPAHAAGSDHGSGDHITGLGGGGATGAERSGPEGGAAAEG